MCRSKVKIDVSLLKRAVLLNTSSLFRMKEQDPALQSVFAKEICKIGMEIEGLFSLKASWRQLQIASQGK